MLTSWVWPSRSSDIHTLEYSVIFGCLSSSRLIVAISRAVVTCPSASSPVALTKWVLVISSCWARSFIRPTNASSLPAIISASATDASLALEIAVAFKRSSTVICSPALNQIWLPPIDSACSEQVTMSSIEMRPSSSASMTSSSVITLVIDAGGSTSSAFFSKSTRPLSCSIRIADFAGRELSTGAAVSSAVMSGKSSA